MGTTPRPSAIGKEGRIEHQNHIKVEDRSDAINSNKGFIYSEAIYEKMCPRLCEQMHDINNE